MKKSFILTLTCSSLLLFSPVFIFASLFLLISCSVDNRTGTRSTLQIGIAEVNYTPEVGLDLVGNYRGDNYTSRGVHDSLYAKALVASDNKGQKVAILVIDICSLLKEPVEFMRDYIASKSDIKHLLDYQVKYSMNSVWILKQNHHAKTQSLLVLLTMKEPISLQLALLHKDPKDSHPTLLVTKLLLVQHFTRSVPVRNWMNQQLNS
jgi:hypothetical protein